MPTDIQVKDKEGYLWKILHNCKEHREKSDLSPSQRFPTLLVPI